MKHQRKRKQTGAMLPLAIAMTLALAVLGTGMCQLLLIIGAGNEVQSAVNAGALRVGQHVLTITDKTAPADREQFADLGWTGKDGAPRFTVGNVNRAIAKSMLIKANAEDMKLAGTGTDLANAHANSVERSATRIVESVKEQLSKRNNLEGEFCNFANSNSLRMGMANTKVQARNDRWETAYLDAGLESNIYLNKNVLPLSQQNAVATKVKDGKTYLKGYENSCLSKLRLIPFRHNERPSLVSEGAFSKHTQAIVATDIPNTFACHGTAVNRNGQQLNGSAMVETNPQQEFDLRARDGWIRIVLHPNDLDIYLNGRMKERNNYRYRNDYFQRTWYVPIASKVTVRIMAGNEYDNKYNLYGCIFPTLHSDDDGVERALVQRLQEMRPDLNYEQVLEPLKSCEVDRSETEKDQVYYVFLNNKNDITVRKAGAADIPATVHQQEQPDGKRVTVNHGFKPVPNIPNFSHASIWSLFNTSRAETFCTLHGWVSWQPSTGYNGCLGEIEHKDTTKCWLFAGGI